MPHDFPPGPAQYFDTKHDSIVIMAQALAGRDYVVNTNQATTLTIKDGVSTDGVVSMGPNDDTVFIQSGVTGHITFLYANNEGHDTVNGFNTSLDQFSIHGFTQQQVTLTDPGNGDVLSFGTTSVQLIGIHDTLSQLVAEHAVVFT